MLMETRQDSKQWARKDLLGIQELNPAEIQQILDIAESFKEISTREIKKVPTLRGKTIVNLFFEPSTRTRTSFEIAAKRLSADAVNMSVSASSVVKGETLLDTTRNLQAMEPDILVIRHEAAGVPSMIARVINASVVNAGDGFREHPTQALLDMMTVRDKKGTLVGIRLAIVGDIAHSRVARSNIYGFTKMGARVCLVGPRTLIPVGIESLDVEVSHNLREGIRGADVVMMLRIQRERIKGVLFPSEREYARFFGLTEEVLAEASRDVIVMHPGPMNRGVEISPEVADSPRSVILDQVANGVAVRMAVLYLLAERGRGHVVH
jgi:aspartate carbamoyltransferase catalytic subunit